MYIITVELEPDVNEKDAKELLEQIRKIPEVAMATILELSQISKEKTKREIDLIFMLSGVLDAWKTEANWGDGIDENHMPIYNRAIATMHGEDEED